MNFVAGKLLWFPRNFFGILQDLCVHFIVKHKKIVYNICMLRYVRVR